VVQALLMYSFSIAWTCEGLVFVHGRARKGVARDTEVLEEGGRGDMTSAVFVQEDNFLPCDVRSHTARKSQCA